MARRNGMKLPVGEPMEEFKEKLNKRLKLLVSKIRKMEQGNPRTIEDSDDFVLRGKYHALLEFQSVTRNVLASL